MSRAGLIDLPPEEEQVDTIENEDDGTQPIESVEAVEQEEQPQEEPNIPEKYRGKSLEEVVQMHQEAEKALGKQGSEVGELRKVVDEYIAEQSTPQQAPQQEADTEVDELDYFTDPQGSVNRAIDNHPSVVEAREAAAAHRRQTAMAALQAKHPDMQEILQDAGFAEWIKASNIRKQLFVRADQQYDAEAADELFSLFKERQSAAKQTVAADQKARKSELKAASTGGARGSGETVSKKVYRRADLIKLMKNDPARYEALQPEIMRAYQEGRVK